jgi:hypothetical protein
LLIEQFGLFDVRDMGASVKENQLGTSDFRLELNADIRRGDLVLFAPDDQRRCGDPIEFLLDVSVSGCP